MEGCATVTPTSKVVCVKPPCVSPISFLCRRFVSVSCTGVKGVREKEGGQ